MVSKILKLPLLILLFWLPVAVVLALTPGEGMTPLADRPVAPAFELKDVDGKLHRLSDYEGKVLVVNFWATWCPPCRAEMPSMQRAWQQLQRDDIEMIAINVGEDEDTIFEFTASYPVEFPLLLDQESTVIDAWGVKGLPTTYVVDTRGRMVYRAIGGREWDDPALLDQLRRLKDER